MAQCYTTCCLATLRFGHLYHIRTPTASLPPTSYQAHGPSVLAVATTAETSTAVSLASYYPNTFQVLALWLQAHALGQPSLKSASAPPPGPSFSSTAVQPIMHPSYPETPTALSPDCSSPLFPPSISGYHALPDYQQHHQLRLDDWGEVRAKLQDPAFRIE